MKRFREWSRVEEKLEANNSSPPLVSEGQIWWASVGENIGKEICGKGESFTRPVLIYKKLANDFYFVIPTTTQPRTGDWFIPIQYQGITTYACLHQAQSIDSRRLLMRLAKLDSDMFEEVKDGFKNLYI